MKLKDIDISRNAVHKAMIVASESLRLTLLGREIACCIVGPAGVGKSVTVRQIADELGVRLLSLGAHSTAGLEQLLIAAQRQRDRGRKSAVLVEDVMQAFTRSRLDIWLSALDPNPGNRHIAHNKVGAGTSLTKVSVPVIFLGNVDPRDEPKLAALTSRIEPILLSFDEAALYEYSVWLVLGEKQLLRRLGLSLDKANLALRYFADHINRWKEISPRQLETIGRALLNRQHWQEYLELTMHPKAKRNLVVEVAEIVPAPRPQGVDRRQTGGNMRGEEQSREPLSSSDVLSK